MRIVSQQTFGGPGVLEILEVVAPTPGPGEVRVAVGAIGVNPVEVAVREGWFPLLGEPPFVLGWDVAGTVDAIGPDVTEFAVGDRVFGMPRFPAAANGYAERVVAPVRDLVRTPGPLDDVPAAALPLVSLTAYQALVEVGDVGPGTRVLVQAAGGGVGHVAVQIAKARGAHVIATASPRKIDFVHRLGADEVVDYTSTDIATVKPVDLVIDPFGGPNSAAVLGVVRDGGVHALLVGDHDDAVTAAARERGIRTARIHVEPNPESLAAIVELVRTGALVPHVAATFRLDQVGAAHTALADGPAGKVVIVP